MVYMEVLMIVIVRSAAFSVYAEEIRGPRTLGRRWSVEVSSVLEVFDLFDPEKPDFSN